MKLPFVFLVLLLTASTAKSAPVTVRTGEHADFTRVVLFFPPASEWTVVQSANGHVVRLSALDGYKLDGFFDLIPRTRITGVTQRPEVGELELLISCDCSVDASLYREGILVVDVGDGVERDRAISPSTHAAEPNWEGQSKYPDEVPSPLNEQGRLIPLFPSGSDAPFQARNDQMFDSGQEREVVEPTSDRLASGFEDQVTRALGDGLAQNFLSEAVRTEATRAFEPDAPRVASIVNLPGIVARGNIDPDTRHESPADLETQTGQACLSDAFFAVNDWGDDSSFNTQMGAVRSALYQEFDRVDESAVTRLARLFVFFGFGEEALQTLQLDQAQSQERHYLAQMARIIDGHDVAFAGFEEQVSCASYSALWAVLASKGRQFDGPLDKDSILRNFKELPPAIQNAVGPRLSDALVHVGDLDASRQVLSRTEGPQADIVGNAIAQSIHAAAANDQRGAIETLEGVMSTSSKTTPDLLIQYFEVGLKTGQHFRDEDFSLSDALRFQAAGSEDFNRLTEVQIRAHLSVGQFDEALEILDVEAPQLPGPVVVDLRERFAGEATARMSDGAFGRFAWSDELLPASRELRTKIADRLLDMGFSDRAAQISALANANSPPAMVEESDYEGRSDEPGAVSFSQAIRRAIIDGPQLADEEAVVAATAEAPNGTELNEVANIDVASMSKEVADAPAPITLQGVRNLIAESAIARQELGELLGSLTIPENP